MIPLTGNPRSVPQAAMAEFEAAQTAIGRACSPRAPESVPLEGAAGRVLAGDIIASEDLVPFARSAMDGFALCSADLGHLPATLPIAAAAFAAAGRVVHRRGTATAIATGAALPAGADCVVPIEDVSVHEGTLVVRRPVASGACVFPSGDDARTGDVLLPAGTRLGPAGLGLLGAAGITQVHVWNKPVVAVICGGDELVAIDRKPAYGQIRDSNGIMLTAALEAAGARVASVQRLPDERHRVVAALAQTFERADLIVTTGGASVGERDFLKSACAELGVEFFFERVALRPAKPTAFGRRGTTFIAILPGNPAAAFVAMHEFVRVAVRRLSGHAEGRLPRVKAKLDGTLHAKPERHFAAFAALTIDRNGFSAKPLANQCSALTRTAATANGFIVIPPGQHVYASGDDVAVDVFDWSAVNAAS